MGEWDAADEICIAVALDSWKPTLGTRLTGQRNPGRHFIFSNSRLERTDPPPARKWNFPPPFGEQDVVGLSLAETITISRHLQTPEIRVRSEEHTSELQSLTNLVCRLLLEKKKKQDDYGPSSQM